MMQIARVRLASAPGRRFSASKWFRDEEFYSNVLQRCASTSDLCTGRAIHGKVIKGSLPFSLFVRNHILNMYVKCGDLFHGHKLFDEMHERNAVSWSVITTGYVQNGGAREAISLFSRMLRDGASRPNEFTLVSALKACSFCDDMIHAYQIYALIVRLGFGSHIFLMNAFITSLIRHGKLWEAVDVFEECPGKDIVTWNAIMAGYVQYSYANVPRFWYRLVCETADVKPDNFTFASVLTGLAALSDLKMGMQVHAQLVKLGHGNEICVGTALSDMYIRTQRLEDGMKAFEEMPERDVSSWNQMAAGFLELGDPGNVLGIIAKMRQMGIRPNKFTLATAINACASVASLEEGKKAHALRIKLGSYEVDVCVDNALLDMYAKCGCMDGAWGVFRSMTDSSVISWTTMIMGCAQNGQAREALKTFEEMRLKGVEPNNITFICLLHACGQGGFVEEGWRYFYSMDEEHGIPPGEDHYVCMVNLLGRAGLIKEAEELILRMPFQPGAIIWQALLGACQVHGDVETGERAANRAMELDDMDPSNYMLLSNMFAGINNWDHVGRLRALMGSRDVKRVPGTSWFGVEKTKWIST